MATVYYRALLEPDAHGGYGVIFPELSGCVSAGDDVADAVRMAAEALAGHLGVAQEMGDPLPAPAHLDAPLPPWLLEEPGADQLTRVLIPVELAGDPVRVDVSLDGKLLARIDSAAAVRGMSRSAFLAEGAKLLLAE